MKMKIHLDEHGNQIAKSVILATPNGEDDQDFEEVLLSDEEKFDPKHEEVLLDLQSELKDEDNIPY